MIYLEKILFYLLIFCLPFQTRKILYQWSGDFNEWTGAYLYLTDLLVLLIFLLWFWRMKKERFFKESINLKSPGLWLTIFLIISLVSLVQAGNIRLGFYKWFKLLEFAGLFFYLKHNFKQLFDFKRLGQVFVASGLVQSFIAFGQYAGQKSLGLKLLRESPLDSETAGVAKIIVEGAKIVRPYGTFPHPNLLAAFLLVSLFCLYYLWLKDKIDYGFLAGAYGLLFFSLYLTFSRAVIFTFLLTSLLYFIILFRRNRKKILALFLLLVILNSIFIVLAWPEISSRWPISLIGQSVSLRAFYIETAFSVIKAHPWLGLGLGNFVWRIRQMLHLLSSWLHQPVHNIYLLIASETGLTGLIVFLFFIFRLSIQSKKIPLSLFFVLFSFLFIGLFDHFLWTLQQGQLLFWLTLGIMGAGCPHSLTDKAYPSGG